MKPMLRFSDGGIRGWIQTPTGEFVRYNDAAAAIGEKQAEIERLTRERDGLKEMNAHLSRGNATLSVVEHKLTAECDRLRVDFAELQADYNESQQEIERLTRDRDGLINQMTANTDTATREFNRLYLEVQRLTHEETLRDDK